MPLKPFRVQQTILHIERHNKCLLVKQIQTQRSHEFFRFNSPLYFPIIAEQGKGKRNTEERAQA